MYTTWSSSARLQTRVTYCNTLQHAAIHCSTLQHTAQHCNTLQHTATHCNTLQHAATHLTLYVSFHAPLNYWRENSHMNETTCYSSRLYMSCMYIYDIYVGGFEILVEKFTLKCCKV